MKIFRYLGLISQPRWSAIAIAILLALCFFVPIWKIELYAPQYPEGLRMSIWIDRIEGDVRQINLLNHYVGMKPIDEKSIPELRYIPKILLGLIFLVCAVALVGRFLGFVVWYFLFFICGTLGMYDFYLWGYDYGNNLNPDAPIKVPGMSYQPPLIGEKQLLNISAYSVPDWGGWFLVVVAILGVITFLSVEESRRFRNRVLKIFGKFFGVILFSMIGCNQLHPEAIQFTKDVCNSCKMTIWDTKFGGEVIVKTGKIFKFDSIECMMPFVKKNQDRISKTYVIDFFAPGSLVEVDKAFFGKSKDIHSPMGEGWFASQDQNKVIQQNNAKKTKTLTWPELIAEKPGGPD